MRHAFRRLLPFLLKYRRQFLVGLACVVVTTSIQLLSPWVLKAEPLARRERRSAGMPEEFLEQLAAYVPTPKGRPVPDPAR